VIFLSQRNRSVMVGGRELSTWGNAKGR